MDKLPINQSVLNDAQVSGTAVARELSDRFERYTRSPSASQIESFEHDAMAHFAGLSCPWVDHEIAEAWRLAMTLHLSERIKGWRRPKNFGASSLQQAGASTELLGSQRGFSPPFGISQ